MRKILLLVVACGVALGGLGVWSLSRAEAKDKPVKDKVAAVDHAPIHHAIKLLEEAKRRVKSTPHKYGGHKVKAIKDIDHAIHQLREALKHKT